MAVVVSVATVSAACKRVYDSCCTISMQGICMTVIASAACMVCVPQLLYQQRAGRVYDSCCSSSGQTTTLVCWCIAGADILYFDAAEHAAFSAAL